MPAVLRNIFLVTLIIWPSHVSAQRIEQISPVDWSDASSATGSWISSWVLQNFASNAERNEEKHLALQEFNRIKRLMCSEATKLQPVGNFVDENMKLMLQLEATNTVLAIIDMQAIKTAMEREYYAAEAEQYRRRIAVLERELSMLRQKNEKLNRANELLAAEIGALQQRSRR